MAGTPASGRETGGKSGVGAGVGAGDAAADAPGEGGRPGPQRRVELVEPAAPDDGHNARIGLALLASLVIGFGPLRDAALGNGSFPQAIARYLVCLAACVGAMLVLGRLLDGAPEPEGDGGQEEGELVPPTPAQE